MRTDTVCVRLFGVGWAAVAAAGCGQLPADPIAFEQREWVSPAGIRGTQFLTEHYDIRTTSRDAILLEVLPEFAEAAYREYARLIPPQREDGERLVVYVYGRRAEWALFTRQFVPAQASTYMHILSGGYMDHPTATSVLWDVKRDQTLALLAHEGLHQYLARHRPEPIPPWLNEGLATQFEHFDLDGPRPIFRPQRNLIRMNSLREALALPNGSIPLGQLLTMHAGQAVTQAVQSSRSYYGQVWLTVWFLRTHPGYRDGFSRLLADAGTERLRISVRGYRAAAPSASGMSDGEAAFRQYITDDLEGFSDELQAFGRQILY